MRKIISIVLLFICFSAFSQTHVQYISEKEDSMALISKSDIDIINNVFRERDVLDSLFNIEEEIISTLKAESIIKDSIIVSQKNIINNNEKILNELEEQNSELIESYNKKLKKEKNKTISFQALTGAGFIAIILLILL